MVQDNYEKKNIENLPERQRERLESYIPVVTKVINEWDYLNVFPCAPEDHYEGEIYSICFHMGIASLGKNGLDFLNLSKIVYIEMAHSFSILEISEKMCLEPAKKIADEVMKGK